tara:strand:- start:3539 stop:3703 length:165 start_codon:yes stop_codon:yes gene_type:complete
MERLYILVLELIQIGMWLSFLVLTAWAFCNASSEVYAMLSVSVGVLAVGVVLDR